MDPLEREAMDVATRVAKARIAMGLRNPWYCIEWIMSEAIKGKEKATGEAAR
ncbi:MAG TPA: hypothetical protein VN549_03690 [Negativicutes bacterium]|nr:hypothetical protein [Negativicutes bacterium]